MSDSSAKATSSGVLKLESFEGEIFEVSRANIRLSKFINTMLADLGYDGGDQKKVETPLDVSKVSSKTLKKVLEWCERHKDDPGDGDTDYTQWEKSFLEKLDQRELYDLLTAANYLDIDILLKNCCTAVKDMIVGKSVKELRSIFNVENDFTPEEEAQVKRNNPWLED